MQEANNNQDEEGSNTCKTELKFQSFFVCQFGLNVYSICQKPYTTWNFSQFFAAVVLMPLVRVQSIACCKT